MKNLIWKLVTPRSNWLLNTMILTMHEKSFVWIICNLEFSYEGVNFTNILRAAFFVRECYIGAAFLFSQFEFVLWHTFFVKCGWNWLQVSISSTYLRTAFTPVAPQSVRTQSSRQYLFTLLGYMQLKAVHRTLMILSPDFHWYYQSKGFWKFRTYLHKTTNLYFRCHSNNTFNIGISKFQTFRQIQLSVKSKIDRSRPFNDQKLTLNSSSRSYKTFFFANKDFFRFSLLS